MQILTQNGPWRDGVNKVLGLLEDPGLGPATEEPNVPAHPEQFVGSCCDWGEVVFS